MTNPIFDRLPEAATGAILGLPAVVHAIIAETGIATPEWVGSITQVSAFGLVAWIVFFMFTRWLPSLQAASAQQLKEQREAHTMALQAIADAHKQAVQTLASTFEASLKSQRTDLLAIADHQLENHAMKSAPSPRRAQ